MYILILFIERHTFLKTSRIHEMLPNHSIKTGCWALLMTIGRIFCMSCENKCQLNCPIVKSSFINSIRTLSPISHGTNTKASVQNKLNTTDTSATKLLVFCDWKSFVKWTRKIGDLKMRWLAFCEGSKWNKIIVLWLFARWAV